MERGVVVGGVMLGVSLLLALFFNINAARQPETTRQDVTPQTVPARAVKPTIDEAENASTSSRKREDTASSATD